MSTRQPNDLAEIDRLLDEFYTEDEKRLWLQRPQPLLDGATAAELIANGQADKVRRVLENLDGGAYL